MQKYLLILAIGICSTSAVAYHAVKTKSLTIQNNIGSSVELALKEKQLSNIKVTPSGLDVQLFGELDSDNQVYEVITFVSDLPGIRNVSFVYDNQLPKGNLDTQQKNSLKVEEDTTEMEATKLAIIKEQRTRLKIRPKEIEQKNLYPPKKLAQKIKKPTSLKVFKHQKITQTENPDNQSVAKTKHPSISPYKLLGKREGDIILFTGYAPDQDTLEFIQASVKKQI